MRHSARRAVILGTASSVVLFVILVFLTALPSVPGLYALSPTLLGKLQTILSFSVAGVADLPSTERLYLGLVTLAFGVNVGLLYAYVSRFGWSVRFAPGFAGAFAAAAGAGCAACGTLLLAPLIATGIGASMIASLPFAGAEIGWIGITLLIMSSTLLIRGILKPY